MNTKASIAKSLATLAIGLCSVSLISYLASGVFWPVYILLAVGAISMLFGLYLILPLRWRQQSVLEFLDKHAVTTIVESLGWLVVLAVFGVALVQSGVGWMIVAGMVIMIAAFIAFYVAMYRIGKKSG